MSIAIIIKEETLVFRYYFLLKIRSRGPDNIRVDGLLAFHATDPLASHMVPLRLPGEQNQEWTLSTTNVPPQQNNKKMNEWMCFHVQERQYKAKVLSLHATNPSSNSSWNSGTTKCDPWAQRQRALSPGGNDIKTKTK